MLCFLPATILHQLSPDPLRAEFLTPPESARPWVYWYFMEGQMTREGITADLEAMKKAGIGGAIFLEVNIGIPVGPVHYMSAEWQGMVGFAFREADRLGLGISMGTGPGWCGAGGPWVTSDNAMQNLVSSEVEVVGPSNYNAALPQPKPRPPFFGIGTLTPELKKQWETYYQDEAVVAIPAGIGDSPLKDLDEKALYVRAPYSSSTVKSRLTPDPRTEAGTPLAIDLTSQMKDGTLQWKVPPGRWTILRFGRTLAGSTTRPAPIAGLGFETDKFEKAGIDAHLKTFMDAILKAAGPVRHSGRGLTALHFDSWEMGSQNWSAHFRDLFKKSRGYDPLPYLPVLSGRIIGSVDQSERFLWDLRQAAQEQVFSSQMGEIGKYAHRNGLVLDVEPYDMNPTSDLSLGATADVPMGEFWSKGFGYDTEYSVDEAVSVGHTNGKSVIAAESFTATDADGWLQHPGSMKAQGDWAFATGINRFSFHRYQHQPYQDQFPGMTMGPYGVHWERTETWWDMVSAYHSYVSRCDNLLRQGLPVADILYLVPEGAPNVFQPPADAKIGRLPDRRGYNYDGCAPDTLIKRARVKDGQIVFPDGMSYRVLVLPRGETMTPGLLRKVKELVDGGAKVVGNLPKRSPSLAGYPECDAEVRRLAALLEGRMVSDNEQVLTPLTLDGAQWIWSANEPDARTAAAVGTQTFRREFTLPTGRPITSARVLTTADNEFHLSVNGKEALEGTDYHQVKSADVLPLLISGVNALELKVENTGDKPNPAGALLKLEIRFSDGGVQTVATDDSWSNAKALGDWKIGPWNLDEGSLPRPEIYPSYASTAKLLSQSLPPDVESDEALRYNHRKVGGRDIYFVANRSEAPWAGDATFRATGYPEWWDPTTGEMRPLPQFSLLGDRTTIPLDLPSYGSGFVVFNPSSSPAVGGENFVKQVPIVQISGPWKVSFEPRFGGPSNEVAFDQLQDWTQRPEEGIHYYSGKAIYRTTFDGDTATAISLGVVKNMASVKLNGKDLGVAWCAPWKLAIPPGLLKPTGNQLEITVANLWPNRLIRDAGLPADKRVTQTTWSPYGPDSPLLPSGLLGPVVLMR